MSREATINNCNYAPSVLRSCVIVVPEICLAFQTILGQPDYDGDVNAAACGQPDWTAEYATTD